MLLHADVNKLYSLAKSFYDVSHTMLTIYDVNKQHICSYPNKMSSFCSEIRKKYNFPVIMLTARTSDEDKISGLTLGADDYVTKPFNPLELLARVKAQIRRFYQYNTAEEAENIIRISGLEVDNRKHICRLYGEELDLTPIEFGIISALCKNAGKVVTTQELFEAVWGEKYLDSSNTVMVHIRRIREKMNEKPKNPKFIKTVWGVGYKIEKDS